jgi:hypothetical protein
VPCSFKESKGFFVVYEAWHSDKLQSSYFMYCHRNEGNILLSSIAIVSYVVWTILDDRDDRVDCVDYYQSILRRASSTHHCIRRR